MRKKINLPGFLKKEYLLLFLLLIIVSIAVNPLGDFCIYDDWSFAKSLQTFVESGQIRFSDWTSMPLITQILWASIFVKIFGFSFTILRISTIVMGFIGIFGTFSFFHELTDDRRRSLIYTVLFLIQPVFLNFIYSFNTDVPFYSIIIWSAYFFARYFNKEKISDYYLGFAIMLVSIMLRDIGVALGFGFCAALLYKKGVSTKTVIQAIAPLLIGFLAIHLWRNYLVSNNILPALYDDGRVRMAKLLGVGLKSAVASVIKNIVWFASYLGVLLSPLFVSKWEEFSKYLKSHRLVLITAMSSFIVIMIAGFLSQKIAGKFTEILFGILLRMNSGELAPVVLNRTSILQTRAWDMFALTLSSFGLSVFIVFICMLVQKFKSDILKFKSENSNFLFSAVSIIVYMGPIILAGIYMKYLIFVFPFMIYIIDRTFIGSKAISKYPKYASILAGLSIFYFSVATTHDVIQDVKVSWSLAEHIHTDLKIPPTKIDAGVCFNGWYNYDHDYVRKAGKNWWWVYDDEYIVLDGILPGYEVISKGSFTRFLPPFHQMDIYGLKRKG